MNEKMKKEEQGLFHIHDGKYFLDQWDYFEGFDLRDSAIWFSGFNDSMSYADAYGGDEVGDGNI